MYSFKKEVEVYAVFNDVNYRLDVSEINFAQSYKLVEVPYKTLQELNYFEGLTVTSFNPVQFDLIVPAIREYDFAPFITRIIEARTFDLYVITKQDAFKVEYSICTNLSFITEKRRVLTFNISGQASKLSRVGGPSYSIPGTPYSRSGRTYNKASYLNIALNSITIDQIATNNIELQTNINWLPFDLVELCSQAKTVAYPTEFVIDKRILAGSFTTTEITQTSYSEGTTLFLEAGELISGSLYGFEFDLPEVSYTSRINSGDVFTQSYDWRLVYNPASLLELITYKVYTPGDSKAILDAWNQPILDAWNQPILESP